MPRPYALPILLASSLVVGCDQPLVDPADTAPPSVRSAPAPQAVVVGQPFTFDATLAGTAFTDPAGRGLTYEVTFGAPANGLSSVAGKIAGTPATPGVTRVTITARDVINRTVTTSFDIVAFAADLRQPVLPAASLNYNTPLPAHFNTPPPLGSVIGADNTPADNAITNAGATLGRVLFYDRRVSANDAVSCATCHVQSAGFADTARLSRGFAGGRTGRHSMSLTNARFYQRGRFFWDERSATLEAQVLQPIQDGIEMGMSLDNLVTKLRVTSYYPKLFTDAFGSSEITSDRIARALAQFVRSMVSANSRFDMAFVNGVPNFNALTPQERLGHAIFNGPNAGCSRCHGTNAQISTNVFNNGLDAVITDAGAGNGRFKTPSLRNIEVTGPYMHDGRFATLEQVVDHYDSGVQNNPGLDPGLRTPTGQVRRLNLSPNDKAALVAFLKTLTDQAFLTDVRFADPF